VASATSPPKHSARPAPPRKRRYRERSGLAAALDVVGERWTLLIVRELLRAPKRYGQLLDALPGIGTNLLVNRLRELEAAGVLGRVLAPSPQSAVVYELSERGRALQPTVDALQAWGDANSDSLNGRTETRPMRQGEARRQAPRQQDHPPSVAR
jgi:DNA-binding HxlR family transcriptional regulator